MILRGICVRRSFYSKLILLGIVAICILFYMKYMSYVLRDNNSGYSVYLPRDNLELYVDSINNVEASHLKSGQFISNQYEKMIRLDLAKQVKGLGDNGKPVTLKGASKIIGDKQLAVIALNEELSEHLSYNRTIPDVRNSLCRKQKYDLDALPTTSVVIIFYNEPYSVLVTTIHSVLNTCDQKILKEIILVDDCSLNEELKDKLDYYIETRLPKNSVKVIRLKNR